MSEQQGLLRIGDEAPNFTAVTTQSSEFEFSAWQEQEWVVFFSHPGDFTPVCATELIEFARQYDRFRQKAVKLIGLSVDSIHAHLAWLERIKEKMGVAIPYPIIADADMTVSRLYGMLHPGAATTATVRAVFVIDPKRIIRALVYYPMNVGRNVDEIYRLVVALQTADHLVCATPVNWQEGEKVLLPPPRTVAEAEERLRQSGNEAKDFYLVFKDLRATKREETETSSPSCPTS